MLSIITCKLLIFIGRLLGRGSVMPGRAALILRPDILARIKLPPIIVAVTGSNGKTTTTDLICKAAKASGKRVVCNNIGSNLIEGITTALLGQCSIWGKVKADIAVLECDERHCENIFRYFSPTHMVIGNLLRDQTSRNGSIEFVASRLRKGIPSTTHLILNADDPNVAVFAQENAPVTWFGVTAEALRTANTPYVADDGVRCTACYGKMTYTYRILDHLGDYMCTECNLSRPSPAHVVTDIIDGAFVVNDDIKIKQRFTSPFAAYNMVATYAVAHDVFGMTSMQIADILSESVTKNQYINRIQDMKLGDQPVLFLLCKHENITGYNGALRSIVELGHDTTVVIIVDALSRKYSANDMSWLWDINFEQLAAAPHVKRVIVGGLFAHDVAVRLDFAGIEQSRLDIHANLDDMMTTLKETSDSPIHLITCFTDIAKFKERLAP